MLSCPPWLPTCPPFQELCPGLRDVERYLNGDVLSGHGWWARLRAALSCGTIPSHAVTGMLQLADVRWRLEPDSAQAHEACVPRLALARPAATLARSNVAHEVGHVRQLEVPAWTVDQIADWLETDGVAAAYGACPGDRRI